jgi:hypothetical protein
MHEYGVLANVLTDEGNVDKVLEHVGIRKALKDELWPSDR